MAIYTDIDPFMTMITLLVKQLYDTSGTNWFNSLKIFCHGSIW